MRSSFASLTVVLADSGLWSIVLLSSFWHLNHCNIWYHWYQKQSLLCFHLLHLLLWGYWCDWIISCVYWQRYSSSSRYLLLATHFEARSLQLQVVRWKRNKGILGSFCTFYSQRSIWANLSKFKPKRFHVAVIKIVISLADTYSHPCFLY